MEMTNKLEQFYGERVPNNNATPVKPPSYYLYRGGKTATDSDSIFVDPRGTHDPTRLSGKLLTMQESGFPVPPLMSHDSASVRSAENGIIAGRTNLVQLLVGEAHYLTWQELQNPEIQNQIMELLARNNRLMEAGEPILKRLFGRASHILHQNSEGPGGLLVAGGTIEVPKDWPEEQQAVGARIKQGSLLMVEPVMRKSDKGTRKKWKMAHDNALSVLEGTGMESLDDMRLMSGIWAKHFRQKISNATRKHFPQ